MREYSKQEITREKCHFCGSRNKLFTELRKEDRTFVGMALRCCNCGKVTFHINPAFGLDVMECFINNRIYAGNSMCIQESYCPHKHCRLYGKDGQPPKPIRPRKQNKVSDYSKLVVKAKNEPDFL